METTNALTTTVSLEPFVINTGDFRELSQESVWVAENLVITNDAENVSALDNLKRIKETGKQVEEARKKYVSPLNEVVKNINAAFSPINEDLALAEKTIKGKMMKYEEEKERIRREEQARLEREHKKKVEAEAKKAERKGIEPVPVAPPPVLMPESSVKSTTATAAFSVTWEAEVTDIKALLQAVIDGSAPIEAVTADMKFLNKQAKAFKKPSVYAGVVFKEKRNVAVR